MSIVVNVNGESINYPQTGDTNWGDEATDFAVQTSSALAKVGLSTGTTVDLPGTLDVTGNTTLDANLSVTGTTSLTGNVTLTNNLTVNGNTQLGNASGDSLTINSNGVSIPNGLNFDTNTLVIDATSNRVGIGISSPSVPLDVQANVVGYAINIRGRSSDNAAQLRFSNNAGTVRYSISLEASSDNFLIYNASSVASISINQTGQLSAVVPGGSTLYPGFLCRAWVNFNGTGTVSIRASGNVSSITDNGTGDYTINFTTAMPDSNYSVLISVIPDAAFSSGSAGTRSFFINSINTANCRIQTGAQATPILIDFPTICVGIIR